jgi:general secretion pathway protein G
MTKIEKVLAARRRHSGFVIGSSFVIRLPRRNRVRARLSSLRARRAFTLIELIVVVAIILILAGLVLSTFEYAKKKGQRARAETEIAALSAACESYKADNGIYPREASSTDILDARLSGNPSGYQTASLYLYKQLSGDFAANRTPTGKGYMVFKPNMLLPAPPSTAPVTAILDPFGNSYGYSTAQAATPGGITGYNPTFDLWSTVGLTTNPPMTPPDTITTQWIKNW